MPHIWLALLKLQPGIGTELVNSVQGYY